MIAAENDPGGVKTDARRDGLDESPEIGRRHAGVTALLVDLVAGRLNEDAPARAEAQRQRGLDDDGWAVQTDVTPARPSVSRSLTSGGRGRSSTTASRNEPTESIESGLAGGAFHRSLPVTANAPLAAA